MNYRPEIDGLRALAVSSVLLFHFWPNLLPHGYLGVDIFFVISGYLISRYILEETSGDSFSFVAFYLRRVRRILPLTIAVSSATLVGALNILIGPDLDRFLQSLLWALGFGSNFFFWKDGGYFGPNDALKPLLHLWSLSVEEQFYLVFPAVFFLLLTRIREYHRRIAALVFLLVLSLIGNILLIRAGGENPAFFLTPTRAWEFGFGALSALLYDRNLKGRIRVLIFISLFAIVFGLTVKPNLLAPGFLAVAGTASFLALPYVRFPVVAYFFESKLVRKIGLISFSLYLWHWPLLVFLRYLKIDDPSTVELISVLGLTFLLSSISYRWIEEPFRRRIAPSLTLRIVIVASLALAFFSLGMVKLLPASERTDLASRIASQVQTNFRCSIMELRPYGASRACLINRGAPSPYNIALVGNSHAQMYAPAFDEILRARGESGLLIPLNGCLPTVDLNISNACLGMASQNLDSYLNDKNLNTIIFALTWYTDTLVTAEGVVVEDRDRLLLGKSLLRLLERVRNAGKQAYLVGPVQIPRFDLPSVLSRKVKFYGFDEVALKKELEVPRKGFDSEFASVIALMNAGLGDRFLMPSKLLCDQSNCRLGDEGGVYFADGNHLGKYGLEKIRGLFSSVR